MNYERWMLAGNLTIIALCGVVFAANPLMSLIIGSMIGKYLAVDRRYMAALV